MATYTKTELENKVAKLHQELSNPLLQKSDKQRIEGNLKYYITKLAELDEAEAL